MMQYLTRCPWLLLSSEVTEQGGECWWVSPSCVISIWTKYSVFLDYVTFNSPLADPGFGQGGPEFFSRICWCRNAKSGKLSKPILARVEDLPKGLGRSCIFNCQIYTHLLFLVLFFIFFNLNLCRYIIKYLFQYERFWLFWQMQFSCVTKSKVLFVHLVEFTL